ncbi:hypothetical protein N4Q63_27290, partial [Leclercia adecarboxylata]|uniref:hypothetical protein n=1 Tax=Leclercia adecarboxylata TaxID=83655 RepID=UPI00234E1E74|nr:hypothetical protein [Leclercia adecarboxylata]
ASGGSFNPFAGPNRGGGTRNAALRDGGLPLPAATARLAAQPLPMDAGPAMGMSLGPASVTPVIDADGLPEPVMATAAASGGVALPLPVPGSRQVPSQASAPRASRNTALGPLPPATTGNGVLDELRALKAENSSSLA